MSTRAIRISGPNLREGVLVDLFLALLAGLPAAVLARCACGMIVRLYALRGTTLPASSDHPRLPSAALSGR
jgi:hypothetical protein